MDPSSDRRGRDEATAASSPDDATVRLAVDPGDAARPIGCEPGGNERRSLRRAGRTPNDSPDRWTLPGALARPSEVATDGDAGRRVPPRHEPGPIGAPAGPQSDRALPDEELRAAGRRL